MKILIIENEEHTSRRLQEMIKTLIPGVEISAARNVEEVKDALKKSESIDVAFADIRLSDGTVFEALDDVAHLPPMIFTTAYDEYAVKAFKYNGIDYLLKPVVESELSAALEKFCQQSRDANTSGLRQLLKQMNTECKFRQRFLVTVKDEFIIVDVAEVSHIISENGINKMFTFGGEIFILDSALDEIEGQLNPIHFFRANRQCIVNINAIKRVVTSFNRKLKIVLKHYPEVELMVSREKSIRLKAWLDC